MKNSKLMTKVDGTTLDVELENLGNTPLPDCTQLVQRIIEQTKGLPQKKSIKNQLKLCFVGTVNGGLLAGQVAAAIAIISISVLFYTMLNLAPIADTDFEPSAQGITGDVAENLIMDEAAWGDLLLMQDEVAFDEFL